MCLRIDQKYKYVVVAVFLLVAVIVVGCSGSGGEGEDVLRERVQAYWQGRSEGNFTKTYRLEYPLLRQRKDLGVYVRGIAPAIKYLNMRVKSIKMLNDGLAQVVVEGPVEIHAMGAGKPFKKVVRLKDRWVLIDQNWYHVPKGGLGGEG